MVADARECGMMQASQQTRFALKLFAQAFFSKKRFFEGYSGVETLVDRFVNGSHATLPELAHDAIAAL